MEKNVLSNDVEWTMLAPDVLLEGDKKHTFGLSQMSAPLNFLRVTIFPDGGIARLRAYGVVEPTWPEGEQQIDLAHVSNGGRATACSNQFFAGMSNLVYPGRGVNMGDGWETVRSRDPSHSDWVIIRLGASGVLERADIDTCHFKGNYPDEVELHACYSSDDNPNASSKTVWFQILPRSKLGPNKVHNFDMDCKGRLFTHVRMTIYPDGGVKRLRLFGIKKDHEATPAPEVVTEAPKAEEPAAAAPIVKTEPVDTARSIEEPKRRIEAVDKTTKKKKRETLAATPKH